MTYREEQLILKRIELLEDKLEKQDKLLEEIQSKLP